MKAKNKIQAILVVGLMLIISASSALSGTVTITDEGIRDSINGEILNFTSNFGSFTNITLDGKREINGTYDNKDTLIRNSNGKYWAVDGVADDVQIQAAIDDVGSYGSVYVGCNTTISSPIIFDVNDYITLDFEGNYVTLDGDIEFVNLTRTSSTTVKNVRVLPSEYQTASIIVVYVGDTTGCKRNNFYDITIGHHDTHWIPGSGWAEHNFTGIEMNLAGTASALRNTFSRITMSGVYNGILLKQSYASAANYGNGNYFEDIYVDQYVNCINFTIDDGATFHFNQNVFNHVKSQTATYSEYGVMNVSGSGNHFDHCLMWDWSTCDNPVYEWWIGAKAYYTTIDNLHNYDDDYIFNEGVSTTMSGVGGDNLLVEDFVQPHDITIFTDGTDYFTKDGTTGVVTKRDDANDAFEDAVAAANGGSIYVKEGVYELHEVISMNDEWDDLTIIGENKYNTIIRCKPGSHFDVMMIIYKDSNVAIRDLTFDGAYTDALHGCNDSLNFATDGDARMDNWTVDNCIFLNMGQEAIEMRVQASETSTNLRITNNEFRNIGDRCIYLWGNGADYVNNSWICNNYMEACDEGMYLAYVHQSIISNNIIMGAGTTGINLYDCQNNTVMMNTISGTEGIDEIGTTCAWNIISWNNVGGCTTGIADGDGVDSQIVNNMGDDLP